MCWTCTGTAGTYVFSKPIVYINASRWGIGWSLDLGSSNHWACFVPKHHMTGVGLMEVPEKRQVQSRSTKSKWWNAISIQFYIHIILYVFCLVCSHVVLTRTRIVERVAGPPLPILTLWLPAPRQGICKEVTKQTTTKVAEVIESQRARLQTRGFFLLFVVYLKSRRHKLARGTGHTRGNTLYVFNFWVEDRAGQQGPKKTAASEFKQILLASSTVGEARRLRMPPDSLKPQKSLTA